MSRPVMRVACGALAMLVSLAATVWASDLPLVDAARSQDRAAVERLLTQGVDVNARQADGSTALHWAVYWDDPETTQLLIRAGADVNSTNDLGVTPLVMASANGSAPIVLALLEAGADPTATLQSGETALMHASRAGSLVAVEALLERGADVNATEQTRGQSALMWAVANAHTAVVRVLLEHGADVRARTEVRTLVFNMGGSRSAGSASGGIALAEVPQGGSTPLLFAARSGDLESAKLLVAAGADVHDTAPDGNTALIMAAHSGHGTLAAYLLEQGADPNAAPLGYTALHAAVLRGTLRDRGTMNDDPGAGVPLVRALLAHGADPNVQTTKGTPVRRWSHDFALMDRWVGATPFWLAAKFLEIEMLEVLADAGADMTIPSRDGTTPLMAAAGVGYRRGGNSAFVTDRRDFSSYNPIANAEEGTRIPLEEERQTLATVKAVVALGGDVNASNTSGETALHAAAGHAMHSVIEYLVSEGADINAANGRGQTPLDLAVYSEGIGRDAIVREDTAELMRGLGAVNGRP